MNLVPVALGWSPRTGGSMFQASPFAGARLGQVEQQWFSRAKAAVAKFDELALRARSIASSGTRTEIVQQYVGLPASANSGAYLRNSVAYAVAEAESHTPVNYGAFGEPQQARVAALEDLVRKLDAEVLAGEGRYGILTEPVAVDPGTPSTPSGNSGTSLLIPILTLTVVLGFVLFSSTRTGGAGTQAFRPGRKRRPASLECSNLT